MYAQIKEISDDLIDFIKPGTPCAAVYERAMNKAEKMNISKFFQNLGNGKTIKMVGHGVGIEVNEPPVLSMNNQSEILENFVITIEFHLMKKNTGVVKLEDTIRIGKNKNEILTISHRGLNELV